MDFSLDPGQVDLRQTVARFFDDAFPLDAVASRGSLGLDRGSWEAMAAMGIPGLLVDPDAGGSGLGVLEATLVFEQIGSHLVPGPVMWTVLAAPLVDGAVDGTQVVTGCTAGDEDVVEDLDDADLLVVVEDSRVVVHRRAELVAEALSSLDPLASASRVTTTGGGFPVGDAEAAQRLRTIGAVLAAAELVGVASRALDVARDHALERHQFGVPIGSFQAVKHMLADMYVSVTLAQSATYAAASVIDDPGHDDPARAASTAKLLAEDAALEGASTAVQVLGGMGFTWEMLPQHLLKRAWRVAHRFRDAEAHASAIGRTLVGAGR